MLWFWIQNISFNEVKEAIHVLFKLTFFRKQKKIRFLIIILANVLCIHFLCVLIYISTEYSFVVGLIQMFLFQTEEKNIWYSGQVRYI